MSKGGVAANKDGEPKKKRTRSTKPACVQCHRAHAACSGDRPCTYCIKHNCPEQCVDAPRKRKPADLRSSASTSKNEVLGLLGADANDVHVLTFIEPPPKNIVTLNSKSLYEETSEAPLTPGTDESSVKSSPCPYNFATPYSGSTPAPIHPPTHTPALVTSHSTAHPSARLPIHSPSCEIEANISQSLSYHTYPFPPPSRPHLYHPVALPDNVPETLFYAENINNLSPHEKKLLPIPLGSEYSDYLDDDDLQRGHSEPYIDESVFFVPTVNLRDSFNLDSL